MKIKKIIPLTVSILMASIISSGCSNGNGESDTKNLTRDEFMNEYTNFANKRTIDITSYHSVTSKGKIMQGQSQLDFNNGQDVLLDDNNNDKTVFGYLYGNIELPLAFVSGKTLNTFLNRIYPIGIKLNETYTKQKENLIYEIKDLTFIYHEDSIEKANIKLSFDKYGLVSNFYLSGSFDDEDLLIDANFIDYEVFEEYNEDTFKSFYKTAITKRNATTYDDVLLTGFNEVSDKKYEFDVENIAHSTVFGGYYLENDLFIHFGCYVGFKSEEEVNELLSDKKFTEKKFGKTGSNNVLTFSWTYKEIKFTTSIYFNEIGYASHFVSQQTSLNQVKEMWADLVDYKGANTYENLDKFAEQYTSLVSKRGDEQMYMCEYQEIKYKNRTKIKDIDGQVLTWIDYLGSEKNNGTYRCPLSLVPLGFERKEEFKDFISELKEDFDNVTNEKYTSTREKYIAQINGKKYSNNIEITITYDILGFLTSYVYEEYGIDTENSDFIYVDNHHLGQSIEKDVFISQMNVNSKGIKKVDAKASILDSQHIDPDIKDLESITLKEENGQISIDDSRLSFYTLLAGFTSLDGLTNYLSTLGDDVTYCQNTRNNDLILWYKDIDNYVHGLCYDNTGLLFNELYFGEKTKEGSFAYSLEFHNYSNK